MSYIGSQPATNFETVRKQVSTTNSGTTITLDYSVSSVQDILVTVNAVVQSYDNYTVSGTTLTLGGTLNNDRVEILYVGRTFQTVSPAVGTVTNDMLAGSIANAKLANSSITLNGSAVSLGGSATISSDSGTESFLALLSSNQNVNDSAYTLAAFDSESYDVGSNYTNTSSNYKYTVPTAGKYRFYSTLAFATQGSYGVDWGQISLYKNGSNIHFVFTPTHQTAHAADVATAQIDITLDCAANDYFQIYGRNNWNSNTTQGLFYSDSSRRSWFGGYRIA
jgi:hypothetical protein